MYSSKDISVIIPTYNRPKDLKETLNSLLHHSNYLREILIVDQSEDNKTKNLILSIKKRVNNIKYLHSKIPSLTIARNLGVKNSSISSKLICFLDDDVDIGKNYFEEIINVFNTNSETKAVSAYVPFPQLSKISLPEIFLRRIFYINFPERNNARILAPYCNTYPISLSKTINSQWLSGVNMVYKKDVFKYQKFDENLLGYTIAEDIDFSYRLYKKYPKSVFITPHADINHRASLVERYPLEKISYINQVDHFYFYFKNMSSSLKEKTLFVWSILGISSLRTAKTIFSPKKENILKLKFFFKSLIYCIKNLDKIKKGKVRDFIKQIRE